MLSNFSAIPAAYLHREVYHLLQRLDGHEGPFGLSSLPNFNYRLNRLNIEDQNDERRLD